MQVKTSSSVISAVLLVVLVAGIGWAAPITSITTTPGLVDEDTPVSVETTVTSISTAGATYSSLYGASSVECASGGISWWPLDRDDLSSASSKNLFLEGLSLTTAVANKPFKAYFTHPAVTASSVFFLFEVGGNDSFTLYPIDAAGSTLGTYELVVGSSDFGVKVMTTGGLRDSRYNDPESPDYTSGGYDVHGLTFTLGQFTGSGDLTGFAGFDVVTSGGDPIAIGAIPEPASLSLLIFMGTLLLGRKRCMRC